MTNQKSFWRLFTIQFAFYSKTIPLFNTRVEIKNIKSVQSLRRRKADPVGRPFKSTIVLDYCWLFVDNSKLHIIEVNCNSIGMWLLAAALVNVLKRGMIADVQTLILTLMLP